jgi:cytochrome c-type biogenesis protein
VALSVVVVVGPLLLAAPLAVAAGLVSFLSPCSLPLVPGYLSYVGGLTGSEVSRTGGGGGTAVAPRLDSASRRRVLAGASLFVLGFSAVFTAYGAAAGARGGLRIASSRTLTVVLGSVTVLLGLVFAGVIRLPGLAATARLNVRPAAGLGGAPLLGAMFAIGWTPCIGPTLAAVLTLSADSATAGRGALLAFLYSAGLGLPFVVVALSLHRAMDRLAVVRRHSALVMRLGGVLLVAIGLLQISGVWADWLNGLRAWIGAYGTVL